MDWWIDMAILWNINSGAITLWLFNIAMGKPSINGQFSMAMLNNQMVTLIKQLDVHANDHGQLNVFLPRFEGPGRICQLLGRTGPATVVKWVKRRRRFSILASLSTMVWLASLPAIWACLKMGLYHFPYLPQVKGRFDKWHVKICTV